MGHNSSGYFYFYKRHVEYKEDLQKLEEAKKLADLIEPYKPIDFTVEEVAEKINPIFGELRDKYPEDERHKTDLFIYFNLIDVQMAEPNEGHEPVFLDGGNWRCVSVVGRSLSYVFFASHHAPNFVRSTLGQFK